MTKEEKKEKHRVASRRWRANNPEKKLASHYTWAKNNPESFYESRAAAAVKGKHGVDRVAFDAMIAAQLGRCGMCQIPMHDPQVDHDHVTGKIRGLLCLRCNCGLAYAEDGGFLRLANAYLGGAT